MYRKIPPTLLDHLYRRFTRREFVTPDPLQFLYDYPRLDDREVVAMVASSLAYGRVTQILKSVSTVLELLGDRPAEMLDSCGQAYFRKKLHGFKHRFCTGAQMADLLGALGNIRKQYGSIGKCFESCVDPDEELLHDSLIRFTDALSDAGACDVGHLIPDPRKASACKRLYLMLRWMVRKDAVDPGGWDFVKPARLVIPLDTHMHNIGLSLGMTKSKQAHFKAAVDITNALKFFCPTDPVKYDFALTRLGIHPSGDVKQFISACNETIQAD